MKLSAADHKLLDNVAQYGFQSLHIFGENEKPEYSFSIGFFETLQSPEVLIFGLRKELRHNMIWELFRQIEAGKRLADGERWSDLIEGFECVSKPIDPAWNGQYIGTAIWHHRYRTGRDDIRAFQIFWPGAMQGLFPWDANCVSDVKALQPLLYIPPMRSKWLGLFGSGNDRPRS